jgi:PPP family 3-phenylpropionic acid transporter
VKTKLILFSFFFLFFAAIAAFSPYLVIHFQLLRFSGTQIGLLTGLTPLITVVSVPIWTGLADKTGRHSLIMALSLLLTIAGLLVFPYLHPFPAVLVALLLINILLAPVNAFANSAAVFMLGDEKDRYGQVRLGGTIGYGLSALAVGLLVESYDLNIAFWAAAGLIFLCFLVGLLFAFDNEGLEQAIEGNDFSKLIKSPTWAIFLIIALLGGVAMAMTNNYFYPYMSELGARESAMGLALAVGTLSEIPVMLLANRFIRRFQAYGTMLIALFFTALRMLLFGLTNDAGLVIAFQLLNGLTIPLLLVAGVDYADDHAPRGLRTTAQGIFNTAVMGVGAGVGGFLGGLLLANIGGQALFLVIGLGTFAGLLGILLIGRHQHLGTAARP